MKKAYTEARDAIFEELFNIATKDKNVILMTVDTGAFLFGKFKEALPNQFLNVGIAEQNAVSVAAGLAMTKKRVFLFGISNFVTLRCFEQIKIDICCHDLPVTIIGMGTGYVYPKDGPTHHMTDIISLTRTLPGMTIWSPSDFATIAAGVRFAYANEGPTYLYVDKGPFDVIYSEDADFSKGFSVLEKGDDLTIISSGIMVPQARRVAERLLAQGISIGIIDLYKIKPLNERDFMDAICDCKHIVTLEENTIVGGIGSLVCEVVAENNLSIPVNRFGIQDTYHCDIGDREMLRFLDGIDVNNVSQKIIKWLESRSK
jgi:transketolase